MANEVDTRDTTDARIESYIYKHIGKKSAREMATDLGVNPEEIIRIKNEILNSVDILTLQVQRAKLIRSMQEIADDAKKAAEDVSDERNKAGLYNSSLAAIKELNRSLKDMSKSDDEKISQLNDLRKREIVAMYISTVDVSVKEVAGQYDISEDALFDIFNKNLEAAAAEMDSR